MKGWKDEEGEPLAPWALFALVVVGGLVAVAMATAATVGGSMVEQARALGL